jgi:hypothetical protein
LLKYYKINKSIPFIGAKKVKKIALKSLAEEMHEKSI